MSIKVLLFKSFMGLLNNNMVLVGVMKQKCNDFSVGDKNKHT